ncbi:hypothetical protein [Longibacter salinarum]|nr:hypothetical protein [Longibacter salinarum]
MAPRIAIMFFLILLIAETPSLAQVSVIPPDPPEVEFLQNKTDEFTGERIVQTKPVDVVVEEQAKPVIRNASVSIFHNDGTRSIVLSTRSSTWALLNVEKAYFLVDGERHEGKVVQAGTETRGPGVGEQNAIMLKPETVKKIVDAETVRMKIGRYVLDVSSAVDKEMDAVVDITE